MKVYLDIVFFVNFGINFLFVWLILTLFNEKVFLPRVIISSLIAGLIMVAMLFDILIYNLVKICGGVILSLIGMGTNRFIIKTSIFYLLHFSLTGIVESFSMKHFHLLIGILVVIILIVLENFRRKSIFPRHLKYNISVTLNDKSLNLKGYLDTGNFVCHNNIPIVFVDNKYYQQELKVSEIILIQTVEHLTKINCYTPDEFIIIINNKKIRKDVYIAFTNLDLNIDCLLNYHLIF